MEFGLRNLISVNGPIFLIEYQRPWLQNPISVTLRSQIHKAQWIGATETGATASTLAVDASFPYMIWMNTTL